LNTGATIGMASFTFYTEILVVQILDVSENFKLESPFYVYIGKSAPSSSLSLNNYPFKIPSDRPNRFYHTIPTQSFVQFAIECGDAMFFSLAGKASNKQGTSVGQYTFTFGSDKFSSSTCTCCASDADCKEGYRSENSDDCYTENCDVEWGSCLYTPVEDFAGTLACERYD